MEDGAVFLAALVPEPRLLFRTPQLVAERIY